MTSCGDVARLWKVSTRSKHCTAKEQTICIPSGNQTFCKGGGGEYYPSPHCQPPKTKYPPLLFCTRFLTHSFGIVFFASVLERRYESGGRLTSGKMGLPMPEQFPTKSYICGRLLFRIRAVLFCDCVSTFRFRRTVPIKMCISPLG